MTLSFTTTAAVVVLFATYIKAWRVPTHIVVAPDLALIRKTEAQWALAALTLAR